MKVELEITVTQLTIMKKAIEDYYVKKTSGGPYDDRRNIPEVQELMKLFK